MNSRRFIFALFIAMIAAPFPSIGGAGDESRPAAIAGPDDSPSKARGKMDLVAVISDSFLLAYQDDQHAENGRPTGFVASVMNAVANLAGFTVRYRIEDHWPAVRAAIRNGKADVIPDVEINEEHAEDFIYTRPYYSENIVLFVLRSNDYIYGASNLRGHLAGSVTGTRGMSLLAAIQDIGLVEFDTPSEALFGLVDGTIIALAYPASIVWQLAKEFHLENRIKVTGPPLATIDRAMAVRRDNPELRAMLDTALAAHMETSEFRKAYRETFKKSPSFWTLKKLIVLSGAVLTVLMVLVGVHLVRSHRAMKAVKDRQFGGMPDPGVRDRIIVLSLVLPLAMFIIFAATLAILYQTAFNQQRAQLKEMVKTQAGLIEVIAESDIAHNFDHPGWSEAATLEKIASALQRHQGRAEFVLAKQKGDTINFVIRQYAPDAYSATPIPFRSSRAEPMRRALMGQSGTMVGRDYHGVMVLAAYEPINAIALGLVAKIDIEEIQVPYVRAGLIAVLITAAIAATTAAFTFGFFNATVVNIKGIGERLRAVLNSSPVAIVLKDRQGRYLLANETFLAWTNVKREDIVGMTAFDFFTKADAEEITTADEKVFSSGKASIVERRQSFAGGPVRDTVVHRCPILAPSGEPVAISVTVNDVTDIKNAERVTRQSDERLRSAIESMQEGFALYNSDDRLIACNEIYRQMSPGTTEYFAKNFRFEDTLRSKVASGWIADAVGREEEFIQERLEQHRNPTRPIIRQISDGQWLLIKETRTPDSGTAITFTNITALKRVEQRLLESEQRFKDIADSASDWFWELNADLRYWYFSERRGHRAIFPAIRMMGKHPWETPNTTPVAEKGWRRHRETLEARKQFRDFETIYVGPDGTKTFINFNGKPVFDGAGKFQGYRGTAKDITERKNSEQALLKLSWAVNQSPAAVIITDVSGTIEYVNAKFTELTGYAAAEAIGNNPRALKSGETPPKVYKRLWNTIAAGKEWRGTLRNKRKNGTVYLAGSSIFPIRGPNGAITHFIGVQQDITEKVADERRLRRSERLESLGGLAAGIAHDFNNLLMPIILLSETALETLPKGSPNRARLENILQASHRGSELVRHISMFSRKDEMERKNIDIHETIRQSMELLRATIPTTISLVESLDAGTGTIFADQAQIDSVLMNLVSNAADAMDGRRGQIMISLSPCKVTKGMVPSTDNIHEGRYARLRVMDNGHGMDEQTVGRIMEPFFTTKPVGKGTGLGLSMVHGIASRHGGMINISSAPGKGTTVDVYFPLVKVFRKRRSKDDALGPGDGGRIAEKRSKRGAILEKSVQNT